MVTKEEEDMDREGGRLSRRIGGVCDSSVSGQINYDLDYSVRSSAVCVRRGRSRVGDSGGQQRTMW